MGLRGAEAFGAADPGVPHNEARKQVWQELLAILMDKHDGDVSADLLRTSLWQDTELLRIFYGAWPLLEAADVVADLWSSRAYLHKCAPWLSREDVQALQRTDPHAWTVSDLPLLDAARQRLGDPKVALQRRRREAAVATERERMAAVVDDLIAADGSDMHVMSMLRGEDLQGTLVDETALPSTAPDLLAGPFAHIVVDEAQELTDARSGRCCCSAARPGASRSSGTVPRPGTDFRSRGRNGSSGSGSAPFGWPA